LNEKHYSLQTRNTDTAKARNNARNPEINPCPTMTPLGLVALDETGPLAFALVRERVADVVTASPLVLLKAVAVMLPNAADGVPVPLNVPVDFERGT
jgi:hypothetical protein